MFCKWRFCRLLIFSSDACFSCNSEKFECIKEWVSQILYLMNTEFSKSYPDIWSYFFEVSYCLISEIVQNWNKKQGNWAHQIQILEGWWFASKYSWASRWMGQQWFWGLMQSFLMTACVRVPFSFINLITVRSLPLGGQQIFFP